MKPKTVKTLTALLLAAAAALAFCGCRSGREEPDPSAPVDAVKSEIATAAPTQAISTKTPEEDQSAWLASVSESLYKEHRAAAETILRGDSPGFIMHHADRGELGGVFFDTETGLNGSWLTANLLLLDAEKTGSAGAAGEIGHCSRGANPFARYPFELAGLVQDRIAQYIRDLWSNEVVFGEGSLYPLRGFCGEDWILAATETDSRFQVHAIFRTEDGENWYEFGNANSIMDGFAAVVGAEILSETTGFVCLHSYAFDDDRCERAYVTRDGGASWEDLMLALPEEYAGWSLSALYCPTFEGAHGVILANATHVSDDPNITQFLFGWFKTEDFGATWVFHTMTEIE
ncbi:MAG: hypothetical protein J5772_00515 [Clostridia bacterium]|nr:hypothetical protein [Clostridia bacterium]